MKLKSEIEYVSCQYCGFEQPKTRICGLCRHPVSRDLSGAGLPRTKGYTPPLELIKPTFEVGHTYVHIYQFFEGEWKLIDSGVCVALTTHFIKVSQPKSLKDGLIQLTHLEWLPLHAHLKVEPRYRHTDPVVAF